ncbi:MAG: type II toxin-antitoxin system VapC family toxin [Chloroflexota bacterium]
MIAYFNGDQEIAEKIKSHQPNVAVSALVIAELLYGARASARSKQNLERVHSLLQAVEVVDFDQQSADVYSRIRLELKEKGRPTGEMDMLIAAVAIANKATLVTHNTKHFENMGELQLEDWLAH